MMLVVIRVEDMGTNTCLHSKRPLLSQIQCCLHEGGILVDYRLDEVQDGLDNFGPACIADLRQKRAMRRPKGLEDRSYRCHKLLHYQDVVDDLLGMVERALNWQNHELDGVSRVNTAVIMA